MIMAVMMNPREHWTDERLDDLSAKFDQGFADLKAEMREGFDRIDKRFEQVDKRFEQVDKRFEQIDKRMERLEDAFFAMNRMLFAGGFVIVAAILGGSALAN